MPIIALKKEHKILIAKNKKAVKQLIISEGEKLEDYDLKYIYNDMARKPYSSGYKEAHNRASLAYYHRNKTTTRPKGRPKKERKNDNE